MCITTSGVYPVLSAQQYGWLQEAMRRMFTSKKLSRKVNYDKLGDLFQPGGGMRATGSSAEPAPLPPVITSEGGPSRAASRAGG